MASTDAHGAPTRNRYPRKSERPTALQTVSPP